MESVLYIESKLDRYKRRKISQFLACILVVSAFFVIFFDQRNLFEGIFLIFLSVWLILAALDAFFYSNYVKEREENGKTYPLSSILHESNPQDLMGSFIYSGFGKYFLARLNLIPAMYEKYASDNYVKSLSENGPSNSDIQNIKTISDYVSYLISKSSSFNGFFKAHAINEKHLRMAGDWIERSFDRGIQYERWWSRNNLARIPGIGKDWAFGQTAILEKYGHFLNAGSEADLKVYREEVEVLEAVLVKNRSSNALVIGESDTSRLAIIQSLATMIAKGTAYPALEPKKIFLMDSLTLSQKASNPGDFENQLSLLLYEAHRVGNVIFVIDNLPVFLDSASTLGVDAMAIFVPYLRSVSLQCIALSDTDAYYQKLQSHRDISEHFELIQTKIKDDNSLIYVIEDEASYMESKYGVFYTYQSLEAITEAAAKYFSSDILANKAVDLTLEIAAHHSGSKKSVITREDVMAMVQNKTGIPVGEMTSSEKDKLMNLEAMLKQRVVGQDEAVIAISQALRRARSGMGSDKRPMGAFIFLGPTGVGKTETAKALGDIFFGPKVPMVRFDMSEFAGADALSRLIGDSYSHAPGILATEIRQHQYGILLLDEFEKANKEVHNLFLQILDEGYFSDVQGKQVNAKNMIIIATSNAASDMIIATPANELNSKKTEIIDQIISRGILKPELINRFDGVIFFHSLTNDNLGNVARLMLQDLAKRMKEKGIELVVTDDLISVLLEKGSDPKFGARPMNRAIADLVEEKIAEGLIQGTIKPGSEVRFVRTPEGNLEVQK